MNVVLDNLTKAKEVIKDPKNWTKRYYAADKISSVDMNSPNAIRFCMIGALVKATGLSIGEYTGNSQYILAKEEDLLTQAIEGYRIQDPRYSILSFNDSPSVNHEDVMAVFDLAIEAAKQLDAAEETV